MSSSLFYKYPAFRLTLLVVGGIILARIIGSSFPGWIILCCCFFVTSIAMYFAKRSDFLFVSLTVMCLCLSAGKYSFDESRGGDSGFLPPSAPVVVTGTISDVPRTASGRSKFLLETSSVNGEPRRTTLLVTLKQMRSDTGHLFLRYGCNVGLRGSLFRPSDERNPGEFSQRQYCEANGIAMLMFVSGWQSVTVLSGDGGWWAMREVVTPAKLFIMNLVDRTIGGEEGEFLKGIFLGERTGIPYATREAFTNSGVAHVLAVSGSNVAVISFFLIAVLQVLRLPRWARVVVVATGLLFYMFLTGSQPPVVRATIMALIFLVATLFEERSNPYNAIGVSALVILGMDTRQLFDVGFQLSFVSVLAIVYLYPKFNSWAGMIPEHIRLRSAMVWVLRVCAVSLAATIGTFPLTAIYFGKVSIVGLITNIVVIPAVGLSVVLGIVMSVAATSASWGATVFAEVNHVVLSFTIAAAKWSAALPFATMDTLRFRGTDALVFYAGAALLFGFSNPNVARKLAVVLLAAMNIAVFMPDSAWSRPADGRLRVSFIDVGQGDAVLIEFPAGQTMLVDAGGQPPAFDTGERIVTPFLKRRGISIIDLFVLTHPHADHIGGAAAVLRNFDVKRVVDCGLIARSPVYSEYARSVGEELCAFQNASAGTLLSVIPDARLYTLHPAAGFTVADTAPSFFNLNNASVTMKLQYGTISIMLSGDAEEEAERHMVDTYGDFLQSQLLKLGHHGSRTSTSEDFLSMVQPRFAVASVGRNNRFNHPSPIVMDRVRRHGAELLRTDEQGAIVFETDGFTLSQLDWRR
jgi:competence protein ComEC